MRRGPSGGNRPRVILRAQRDHDGIGAHDIPAVGYTPLEVAGCEGRFPPLVRPERHLPLRRATKIPIVRISAAFAASLDTEKLRDRLGELLRNLIHRIVFLTFEHDESPPGQSIH